MPEVPVFEFADARERRLRIKQDAADANRWRYMRDHMILTVNRDVEYFVKSTFLYGRTPDEAVDKLIAEQEADDGR